MPTKFPAPSSTLFDIFSTASPPSRAVSLVLLSIDFDCGRYWPSSRLGKVARVRRPDCYLRAGGSHAWNPSLSLIQGQMRRVLLYRSRAASPLYAQRRRRHGAALCQRSRLIDCRRVCPRGWPGLGFRGWLPSLCLLSVCVSSEGRKGGRVGQ